MLKRPSSWLLAVLLVGLLSFGSFAVAAGGAAGVGASISTDKQGCTGPFNMTVGEAGRVVCRYGVVPVFLALESVKTPKHGAGPIASFKLGRYGPTYFSVRVSHSWWENLTNGHFLKITLVGASVSPTFAVVTIVRK